MKIRAVTALLLMHACVAGASVSHPSDVEYLETVWNTENGLPQNSVNAILQTRDGYLWLGTFGGLVRFDGIRFKTFNTGNTPGLNTNRILSLFEAHDGTLWIGTDTRDVMTLKDGVAKTYTVPTGPTSGMIYAIQEDDEGAIWIGTARGLARFRDGQFTICTEKEGVSEHTIWSIQRDRQDNLFFSTDGTLMRFHKGVFTSFRQPQPPLSHFDMPLLCQANGSCWIASKNGVARFRQGQYTNFRNPLLPGAPEIRAMLEDRRGNLWLAYRVPTALIRFREGRFSRFDLKSTSEAVRSIFEDREGNLWLGTDGAGLVRLKERRLIAYTAEDGLPGNSARGIVGDQSDKLYIATSNGLARWARGELHSFRSDIALLKENPSALCLSADGSLWVGTDGGLLRIKKNGKFVNMTTADGLSDLKVNSIMEDRGGDLWVGTVVGLNRLRDGKFTTWRQSDGLVHNDVRLITQARDGSLWIGTVGGLGHFKAGMFTNYTTANGLPNNQVRDVFETENGGLWIGTYGGGLSYLQNGQFTPIRNEQGLFDDFIARILPDKRGNFWFLSNHGIFRVKRSELNAYVGGRIRSITSVSYGVSDGMVSSEGNGGAQPAGWRAADGRMWFPTIKGVAVIDPIETERPPPLLAIEEVRIDGKPLAPNAPIEMKPVNQELEIHYTALSFTRPELVQFKYRLDGVNTDWIPAGTRRTVTYSHLPPGHYSFVVTADNGSGVWNTQGKTIGVRVIPAFWQTGYFAACWTLLLGAALFWLYRWRVTHLYARQRRQEAFSRQLIESQEAERKRIAAELHDSLGQNLLIIKNRAALGLITSNDLDSAKRQLEAISASASQAIDETRQIAYDLRPYHLDRLGLESSLEDMIERVAASSGIRFSTNLAAASGALPKEAEIGLYRVIQECISNVVKHSNATEAEVLIIRRDHALHIRIEDNGKGIDRKASQDGKRQGFGLIGMAERIKMLGGTHSISSLNGKGTVAEFVIPLTQGREGRNGDEP